MIRCLMLFVVSLLITQTSTSEATFNNQTLELFSIKNDSIVSQTLSLPLKELTRRGYKLLEEKNYEEALTYYSLAASKGYGTTQKDDLREYAKALNNIGYIYLFFKSDPGKAYPYLLRARKIAEDAKEYDILAGVLDNIAKVYDDFGDSEKALELYNRAMKYATLGKTDISPVMQLMVFNDALNCAVANERIHELTPSLEIFQNLPTYDYPMGRYSKRMCEGLQKIKEGKLEAATSLILSAEKLINANQDSIRYIVDHYLTLSNVYKMRNLEDCARKSLNTALQLAIDNKVDDRLPRIYHGLGVLALVGGDSITAQRMHLKAYQEDEKLHSGRIFNKIKMAETNVEVENLNLVIAEERMKHSHRITVIRILVCASVLVIILLVFILQKNRRLTRSYHDLVTRHQSSLKAEEAHNRLRMEYEQTILELKQRLDKMPANDKSESEARRMSLPVDEVERLRIISESTQIFSESPLIYNNTFSIAQLAEIVKTKPRYLSSLLNETFGKTFSELLAEARVKKACDLLLSPDFPSKLTIESIAEEVGYRSRTHFTSVFKKITGVTPLQYASAAK